MFRTPGLMIESMFFNERFERSSSQNIMIG